MKRLICLLLVLGLLIPVSGCSEETLQSPGTFYYRSAQTAFDTPDGVVAPETRELAGMEHDAAAILKAYFAGPEDPSLVSPFPRDTKMVSWEIRDGVFSLTMNDAFAGMTGVELTIACVCAAKTILGLFPVDQVRFQVRDGLLEGEKSLTFSHANISLADDSLDQAWATFTVYYTDRDMRYLIAQDHSVNLATEDDLIRCLVETLMKPPAGSTLISAIPEDTKLLDYSVSDGLCTLNLSGEFERNGWRQSYAQRLTLLSVVNTLTQLESVEQVEFQVEGNLLIQYRQLNIAAPLAFEEGAIGPVRTGINEFDATLYLSNGTGPYLAAVPARVRHTGGLSEAELIVNALLNYSAINGFYSTIPEGTELNALSIRNGTCYLDLSAEFLSSTSHLVQSVHSIVASVCTTEGVNSVQITVDGRKPEGDYAYLFAALSPRPDWFL